MSVTLVCTACGARLEQEWIRSLGRGRPFVCPRCSRQLVETGYVEVTEEARAEKSDGREAAA